MDRECEQEKSQQERLRGQGSSNNVSDNALTSPAVLIPISASSPHIHSQRVLVNAQSFNQTPLGTRPRECKTNKWSEESYLGDALGIKREQQERNKERYTVHHCSKKVEWFAKKAG